MTMRADWGGATSLREFAPSQADDPVARDDHNMWAGDVGAVIDEVERFLLAAGGGAPA